MAARLAFWNGPGPTGEPDLSDEPVGATWDTKASPEECCELVHENDPLTRVVSFACRELDSAFGERLGAVLASNRLVRRIELRLELYVLRHQLASRAC